MGENDQQGQRRHLARITPQAERPYETPFVGPHGQQNGAWYRGNLNPKWYRIVSRFWSASWWLNEKLLSSTITVEGLDYIKRWERWLFSVAIKSSAAQRSSIRDYRSFVEVWWRVNEWWIDYWQWTWEKEKSYYNENIQLTYFVKLKMLYIVEASFKLSVNHLTNTEGKLIRSGFKIFLIFRSSF